MSLCILESAVHVDEQVIRLIEPWQFCHGFFGLPEILLESLTERKPSGGSQKKTQREA